jgi:hypothetical protein
VTRRAVNALRSRVASACGCLALLCALPAAIAAEQELERTGGPFVPTPQIVVDNMLQFANVGAKDYVIDLGSGNGVIVLTAASKLNASGHGVDIDPELVRLSNAEAKRLGLADRASFRVEDVFKADLSRATVIMLYLLPSMMANLRSKILNEAKPGTRVVSHDYTFAEWQPDDQIVLEVPEKEKVNGVPRATISLWIVPAQVHGRWQLQVEGGERYDVNLQQNFQSVRASASGAGRDAKFTYVSLKGTDIALTIVEGGARRAFTGKVVGDSMQGTVQLDAARTVRWSARKT